VTKKRPNRPTVFELNPCSKKNKKNLHFPDFPPQPPALLFEITAHLPAELKTRAKYHLLSDFSY
jgi:hypothetical protein